jgi:hypothetical protein
MAASDPKRTFKCDGFADSADNMWLSLAGTLDLQAKAGTKKSLRATRHLPMAHSDPKCRCLDAATPLLCRKV